ncbi:hypothetical protein D3C71_1585100 [compost metagenome]
MREVVQILRAQHGSDEEFSVFQILGNQFIHDKRNIFGVVQLVVNLGFYLLGQLGQSVVMERLVHFWQFAHQFITVLRQLKMPGGQLSGIQIHQAGFDLTGTRFAADHVVQVNGYYARVRIELEDGATGDHFVGT